MAIRIADNRKLAKADLLVGVGKSEGDMIVLKPSNSRRNYSYIMSVGSHFRLDGKDDEEDRLRSVCGRVMELVSDKRITSVLFDIKSFLSANDKFYYAIAVLYDELSDICKSTTESALKGQSEEIDFYLLEDTQYNTDFFHSMISPTECRTVITTSNNESFFSEYEISRLDRYLEKKTGKEFRELLAEIIQKSNILKNSDVYKAAAITKYTFSKISNFSVNPPNKPSKNTVAALAIGLSLGLNEATELYHSAGYHLGETELLDKIIRFCIGEKIYDIDKINHYLHVKHISLLGERPRGPEM